MIVGAEFRVALSASRVDTEKLDAAADKCIPVVTQLAELMGSTGGLVDRIEDKHHRRAASPFCQMNRITALIEEGKIRGRCSHGKQSREKRNYRSDHVSIIALHAYRQRSTVSGAPARFPEREPFRFPPNG